MWEIDDVLQVDGDRALVSWVGYDKHDWVSLTANPELKAYIHNNRANPSSCNIQREMLAQRAPPATHGLDDDILVIRQVVYDQLGGARYTQEGNVGFEKRVNVAVPFPVASWQRHFMPVLGVRELGNFEAQVSVSKLSQILGTDWNVRSYPTSTETYVSTSTKVKVKWGYKLRPLYNHDCCPR